MGTRNLTMVINKKGELKVAQYGQWDGYPSGQGATILEFAKDKEKMAMLEQELENVKFYNNNDEILNYLDAFDNGKEWTEELRYWFNNLKTRDLGGSILENIINIDKASLPKEMNETIYLDDSHEFGKDSLFCEWAYCINLQTNKLECFGGFNKDKSKEHPRFATNEDDKYYGIKLIKEYDLDNLPDEDTFIKELEGEDE